jgi:predicted transcriptional regulator
METSKNVYDIIKPHLAWGDISNIAKEHGVTKGHVSKILHGEKKNPKILLALYEKAKLSIDVEEKIRSLHKSVA